MSAPFTEQNILDLQELLNLSIDELELNSFLRSQCSKVEDIDARLSIDKTGSIQDAITEIKAIDADIITQQKDVTFSASSIDIDDEYSVSYQEAGKLSLGYKQRRNELLNGIRRDLGIGQNYVSGRAVRR